MRTFWVGIALLVVSASSLADEHAPPSAKPGAQAQAAVGETNPYTEPETTIEVSPSAANAASCRPPDQIALVVGKLLDMGDANHDDRVTKAEAQALGTRLVNGFFARADANRNGTLTAQEARDTRTGFMVEQPALAMFARQCRGGKTKTSFMSVARLLDLEYGRPVSVTEARNAVKAAIDDVFVLADADKDGSLDASEATAASMAGARALSRSVFKSADGNRDKALSVDEFKSSIDTPLRMAFHLADADNSGKLDEIETAAAVEELSQRLLFPAPADEPTEN